MSATDFCVSIRSPQLEKLDRLRWPAIASVTVCGVQVGIRANALAFLGPLISRIPSGACKKGLPSFDRLYSVIGDTGMYPNNKRRDCNYLFADGRRLAGGASWGELCDIFEADMEAFVAARSRGFVFVHAGVVSWRGQGIVIPGKSHSGKTTLVRALLELGATYYSDEFAVLDPDGQLHPFPRSLCVRSSLGAAKIPAAKFGAATAVAPAHVRLVILTKYVPGLHWRPKVLSQGEGILGMIYHTFSARRNPELALSTLQKATEGADVLSGARGEAKDTARWAVQHLTTYES